MKTPIQFHLNGEEVAAFVESGANLLDTLRESIGDLSVKGGCWQGTCGTCTVLIDGVPESPVSRSRKPAPGNRSRL